MAHAPATPERGLPHRVTAFARSRLGIGPPSATEITVVPIPLGAILIPLRPRIPVGPAGAALAASLGATLGATAFYFAGVWPHEPLWPRRLPGSGWRAASRTSARGSPQKAASSSRSC